MSSTHPGRVQVQATQTIRASPDDVWVAISTPGHLELVHPHCERKPVHVWPGHSAPDEVHYRSGRVYHRHFSDWLDGVGYDLDIGALGEPTSHVKWRIARIDGRACSLTIVVWPRQLVAMPIVRGPTQRLVMQPLLRRYLSSVVRGVEWFVKHDEPVAEDQFGKHLWFSKRG